MPQKLGQLTLSTSAGSRNLEITSAEIALELINEHSLLYCNIICSHSETHGNHEVFIQDFRITLLMPVNEIEDHLILRFPNAHSNHPEWEKTIYSNAYEHEHLMLIDCDIEIQKSEESFLLKLSAELAEGLQSRLDHQPRLTANCKAVLLPQINREMLYFLDN